MATTTAKILYSIEAINNTRREIGEVENGLERLRKARLSASRVVLEQQRTQRFLTQAYAAQHQQFMDTISVMRNVGYIGRGLLTMWQAYTIGQMQVSQSIRSLEEAHIAANTALELYGENSVVYLDAADNVEKLEEAAKKAQNSMDAGYVAMGLTAVGTLAQLGTLLAKLQLIEAAAIAIPVAIGLALAAQGATVAAQGPEAVGETIGLPRIQGVFDDWMSSILPGGLGESPAYTTGGRGGGITVTQINYGVEGAAETLDRLQALLDIFANEGEI